MPSKEQIQENIFKLKSHCWALGLLDHFDAMIEPDQVWTGKQYGASFELMRPDGVSIMGTELDGIELTLRGKITGKERLVTEFKNVLGDPKTEFPARRFVNPWTLYWDIKEVLDRLY